MEIIESLTLVVGLLLVFFMPFPIIYIMLKKLDEKYGYGGKGL